MSENYASLSVAELRALAKEKAIKNSSSLKKAELVEALLALEASAKEIKKEKAPVVKENVVEPKKRMKANIVYAGDHPPKRTNTVVREVPVARENLVVKNPAVAEMNSVVEDTTVVRETSINYGERTKTAEEEGTARTASAARTQNQENDADGAIPSFVTPENSEKCKGILEVMGEGFGFIRSENYLSGESDVYVSPAQIRRFRLRTGDVLCGMKKQKTGQEKFCPLVYIESVNNYPPGNAAKRVSFENLTPIFPDERIKLETPGCSIAMRVTDLVSPVGKGQRGMIVSPPKAGKTTLLKDVARSILISNPKMHMLILLIDERPEEVTDIKEAIVGDQVEVIYSTFDETPEHHMRVAEMVIERARRLVEHKEDVVILLDSITRLTRAYNMVIPPSGRTLSGGLDPAALHMPKRFFGAARNMREGGSLTILATALVDTGSKMDDVVYEEFKGTGNMEMVLDRKLSEKRIFPAIDLAKSGTRREDLLLDPEELDAINIMRKALNGLKPDEATDKILEMFAHTKNNREFIQLVKKNHFL